MHIPLPPAPDGVDPTDFWQGWGAMFGIFSGAAILLYSTARGVSTLARQMTLRTDEKIRACAADAAEKIADLDCRVAELERAQHENDKKIIALEGMGAEISSVRREIDAMRRSQEEWFRSLNDRLEDFSNRCLVFHGRGGGAE